MKAYYIMYKMYSSDTPHGICVLAKNKMDAYNKVIYEVVPSIEKESPYSAWVQSVTYNNGNYVEFKTFEGNPY